MNEENQRQHARAPCFLMRSGSGVVPVFAFRSPEEPEAIAALVVDIGAGGLQILTQADDLIERGRFTLELISDSQDATNTIHTSDVQWVWSRPEGMYVKSGFSFTGDSDIFPTVLNQLSANELHVLRCVLHPLAAAAPNH